MPEDPTMGGDMNAPMPEDPTMGDEMPQDPNMSGDMPEANGDDSTMSIINQLSDEDRESVRAYAESMLNKDGNKENDTNIPSEEDSNMAEQIPQDPSMGECKRFTKKQLKEQFGVRDNNKSTKVDTKSLKRKNTTNKTPFEPPMFK